MAIFEALGAALIGAPILDLITVLGFASKLPSIDFNYRYWPLSRLRMASLALLATAAFVTFFIARIPEDRYWPLLPLLTAMAVHFVVALCDIARQRGQS